jgi:hypothetical protein
MPFQRVPETVQIAMVFEIQNVYVRNLYYAQKPGGYNQADIDGLAAEIDNTMPPAFYSLMWQEDAYLETEVKGLDTEFDIASGAATPHAGSVATGRSLPLNVAFAVRQKSGLSGRSARGRVYIAGVLVNQVSFTADQQSYLTQTAADAWAAAVDGVRITIANYTTWDPVLVSRYHNGSKRAEAVVFPWIDTDYSSLKVATRRSRLR